MKLWDIEAGLAKHTLKVGEVIQSLSWSANGALLVTTSRDKKLRIWDARQEKPIVETQGHAGAKNSRAVWLGEHDRIATTGFSRMSDRQLALWDIRAYREPVGGFQMLDSISGVCVPFWDDGTQCLYLAGKGDGNIRYYEYENDNFEYLSEYKSADPQRGIAFVPKRGVNTHENEIMRAYKTVSDGYIEPVSFIVPRRADAFQEDIYPPTVGLKPAVSGKEWFDGAEGLPPKVSMESLFEGNGLSEVPADQIKPVTKPAPVVESTTTPAKKEIPETIEPAKPVTTNPPASMKDQGASMSSMVDKFVDKDAVEDEEEESDFEEIQKPVTRETTVPTSQKTVKESVTSPTSTTPKLAETPAPESTKHVTPATTERSSTAKSISSQTPEPAQSKPTSTSTSDGDLRQELKDMKVILTRQTEQIATLQKSVESLVAALKTT